MNPVRDNPSMFYTYILENNDELRHTEECNANLRKRFKRFLSLTG